MFTGGIVRPMLLCFNHNRVMPPFAPSASSSQHTPSASAHSRSCFRWGLWEGCWRSAIGAGDVLPPRQYGESTPPRVGQINGGVGFRNPVARGFCEVSPFEAEQSEEVGRIGEDFPCLTEASLAAEFAPHGRGLGKIAAADVVPDLVPFGWRQYAPQGLVDPFEAIEPRGSILVEPARRFVEQEQPAGPGWASAAASTTAPPGRN